MKRIVHGKHCRYTRQGHEQRLRFDLLKSPHEHGGVKHGSAEANRIKHSHKWHQRYRRTIRISEIEACRQQAQKDNAKAQHSRERTETIRWSKIQIRSDRRRRDNGCSCKPSFQLSAAGRSRGTNSSARRLHLHQHS